MAHTVQRINLSLITREAGFSQLIVGSANDIIPVGEVIPCDSRISDGP